MRAGRIFLVALIATLAIDVVVGDLWRAIWLGSGVSFLCWGLLAPRARRPSTAVGCVLTGFAVGMFGHHPLTGAMLGAVIAVLLWRPLGERNQRLKERT